MILKSSVTPAGMYSQQRLRDMIGAFVDPRRIPGNIKVLTDLSEIFQVDYDNVVVLDNHPYLIRQYEREGRFSIDEQPKFWVRRAIDLEDGSMKVLKMVFPERFQARVGDIVFECVRSPGKEARILSMVRGHPHFMQGFSVADSAGNIIRIIDFIHGTPLDRLISDLGKDHEDYYHSFFPSLLAMFIDLVRAIAFLHERGEKHGDIRRDHIIQEKEGGAWRWIDFDYNYWHQENMFGYDLFGLGNVLVYLTGRGEITLQGLKHDSHPGADALTSDDMNIIFHNRVVNLKKIYPYVHRELNFILLHFSKGADLFYDTAEQLLDDLYEAENKLVATNRVPGGTLWNRKKK